MLNILVCMKQVPDTQKVKINPETNTLIRKGVPSITNPFDESALEEALEIKEVLGGSITVLTMGIPASASILKDAISLGADRAYLLSHRDFAGADTLATSYTLSKAIKKLGYFDILLLGKQAIDGDTAQVGPEISGWLGLPVITYVNDILEIDNKHIIVERMIDNGKEIVKVDYPIVLTVVKAKNRLRMPCLNGILRSLDEKIFRFGSEDIGIEKEKCGLKGSPTRVKKIFCPEGHSKVRFLEGSNTEKAKLFIDILQQKGIVR